MSTTNTGEEVKPEVKISLPDRQLNSSLSWSQELSEFLGALDSYAPTVPIECVQYYMGKSGIYGDDLRVAKVQ